MTLHGYLDGANCWHVSGVRSAAKFFRAILILVPEATHMYLEGAPDPEIVALISAYGEQREYGAPAGTMWSWPGKNQRFSVRPSADLLAKLAEAAAHLAEPEICCHVHFYREDEALVQWFDAFSDPLLVSKAIRRETVETFCAAVNGELSDTAA